MARTAVYIVDDDAAVRDSMAQLLGMHGYELAVQAVVRRLAAA